MVISVARTKLPTTKKDTWSPIGIDRKGIPNMHAMITNMRTAHPIGKVPIIVNPNIIAPAHTNPTGIMAVTPIKGKATIINTRGTNIVDINTIRKVDVTGRPTVSIIPVNATPNITAMIGKIIANIV